MKKLFYFIAAVSVICFGSMPRIYAGSPPPVLIVELQTGQEAARGNDFIELYNPGPQAVDVTGWKLQSRAADKTGDAPWTTKKVLTCSGCTIVMAPFSRLVLATYDVEGTDKEVRFTSGFDDKGGQIRFVQPEETGGVIHDWLGYGTALAADGEPAPAPPLGKSLKRKVNEDGYFVVTHNNKADFHIGCVPPTPGSVDDHGTVVNEESAHLSAEGVASEGCEVPGSGENEETTSGTEPHDPPSTTPPATEPPVTVPASSTSAHHPIITEILPDPASPKTDSHDEFIELHNPHAVALDLKGYVLRSGSDMQYSFTLDGMLDAGEYLDIWVEQSGLSLSNKGSGVKLYTADGRMVDEAPDYGDAKEGQAWAKTTNGLWQWTEIPTPGAANSMVLTPPKVVVASAKVLSSTSKKAAAPKTTAPKPKTTTAKPAKSQDAAKTTSAQAISQPASIPKQPHYWLLVPVAIAVLAYAGYEYRHDIARYVHKMRQYFKTKV